MAQREGSVFIYLFVATLVLLVILVAVSLLLNADKEDETAKLLKAQADLTEQKGTIRNLTLENSGLKELISGSSEGFSQKIYSDELVKLEEKMSEILGQLANEKGEPYKGVSFKTLVDPYGSFTSLLTELKSLLDDRTFRMQATLENHANLTNTSQEQIEELSAKNSSVQDDLSALETKSEQQDVEQREKIESLTNDLAEIEEDCTQKELDYKQQIAFGENRILQLLGRIKRLNEEKLAIRTIEDIEPDGSVLRVEPQSRTVWIDLGRNQHLHPGLVFRVFQYVGGKKQWKGTIEVSSVSDDYSEGKILSEEDSLNPLAEGDQITSPFYDPKATPVFVFAGDGVGNPNISLSMMKRKLTAYGAKIESEVRIDTDFLVALEKYQTTEAYQAARELGVTILRESDVIEYITSR